MAKKKPAKGEKSKITKEWIEKHPGKKPSEYLADLHAAGHKFTIGTVRGVMTKMGLLTPGKRKAKAGRKAADPFSNVKMDPPDLADVALMAIRLGGIERLRAAVDQLAKL